MEEVASVPSSTDNMLIKYQSLAANLNKSLAPVYLIIGQDQYLMNDAAYQIKQACSSQGQLDRKSIQLVNPSDWSSLLQEANSYSLFSDNVLINAHWDKKTLDKVGKEVIKAYISDPNPRCQVIINAPNLPAKQTQWLANEKHVIVVQAYSFSATALQNWIEAQLQKHKIKYDLKVPALILQYTQGNMLACAQAIEKLAMVATEGESIELDMVQSQLIDQCDYQLYELTDACLAGQPEKAIHLLRHAYLSRKEPTLILWLLVQDIRLLIQLSHLLDQSIALNTACSQLKIWPQKIKLYQSAISRLPKTALYQLLQACKRLDDQIKSNQSHQIWHGFEKLALKISSKNDVLVLS